MGLAVERRVGKECLLKTPFSSLVYVKKHQVFTVVVKVWVFICTKCEMIPLKQELQTF